MSEQNGQANPEVYQRALLFADAYRKGGEQRAAGITDDAHEEHVRKYWRRALIACLKRQVKVTTRSVSYRMTTTSFDLTVSDETRYEAVRFLAAHFDWPLDKVLTKIQECGSDAVTARKLGQGLWGLLIVPVMAAVAAYYFVRRSPEKLPFFLLVGALLILGFMLYRARERRLRSTARQGGCTVETLEKCCDICAAGPLQNISRGALAVCAVLVILAGGYMYYRNLPPSMDRQAADVLTGYNSAVPTRELDRLLLKDGRITEGGVQIIEQTFRLFPEGGEHALQLAVYVNQRVQEGYPEETAKEKLNAQIAGLDLKEFSAESNRNLLGDMVQKVPWSGKALFERWLATGARDDADMAGLVGEGLKGLEYGEKQDCMKRAKDAGLPYAVMAARALTDEEISDLSENILTENDPENLSLQAGTYVGTVKMPEAIIPVLYRLRAAGISLGEVFPEGIEVAMDLEPMNYSHANDKKAIAQFPAVEKYVILRRAEKAEPYENLRRKPRDGYDAHDKSKAENFEVLIDAGCMDRLPLEHFPAGFDECSMLIVGDMTFEPNGYYQQRLANGTTVSMYTPKYARMYRIMIVQKDGVVPLHMFAGLIIRNPELKQDITYPEAYLQMPRNYLPKENAAWIDQQLDACLARYEEADWNTLEMMLKQQST